MTLEIIIGEFMGTQLCANIIQIIILLVTIGGFYIAIRTYQDDVKQKKLKNTLDYINSFYEGNWVTGKDKFNWNKFYKHRLCRNACGEFSLTGKFSVSSDGKEEERDVIEIFSEGIYSSYGSSISNILDVLEFIAKKANNNEIDIDLIRIRLLRFYQLANFYNDVLGKENADLSYINIKILYSKLEKYFVQNEPIGNYCEFPI